MTTEEAKLFLKFEGEEELEDAYELALFEIRQFLLSKPVLLKTFQSKQARISKLREAFLTLGGKEEPKKLSVTSGFVPSEIVGEHFIRYHAAKNSLKKTLALSYDSYSMENSVDSLVELERAFVEPFSGTTGWTEEEVLVSKDPDVMLVLSLIREQAEKGIETIGELHKNRNNLPLELARELKRLSLHKNYLYE